MTIPVGFRKPLYGTNDSQTILNNWITTKNGVRVNYKKVIHYRLPVYILYPLHLLHPKNLVHARKVTKYKDLTLSLS